MILPILFAAAEVASAAQSADIVVTASRIPEKREETAASVTIIDDQEIARLGEPQVHQFLRLVPSFAVSSSWRGRCSGDRSKPKWNCSI